MSFPTQSECRLLGHFLAAVHSGRVAGDALRAADHGDMDPIPKEEMGNATSMFNLMRNLGGSIGIAAPRRSCSAASSFTRNGSARM